MAKDKGDHTPEWLATLGTLKKQELENNRKVIDRSQAFRDGLIRPPWLKKTVEGVTKKVEGVTKEVRAWPRPLASRQIPPSARKKFAEAGRETACGWRCARPILTASFQTTSGHRN